MIIGTCQICGLSADHIHHIIYRSKWPGGVDVPENKMMVCYECHLKIHDKLQRVPENLWKAANLAYKEWLESKKLKKADGISSPRLSIESVSYKRPSEEEIVERSRRYKEILKQKQKKYREEIRIRWEKK